MIKSAGLMHNSLLRGLRSRVTILHDMKRDLDIYFYSWCYSVSYCGILKSNNKVLKGFSTNLKITKI